MVYNLKYIVFGVLETKKCTFSGASKFEIIKDLLKI